MYIHNIAIDMLRPVPSNAAETSVVKNAWCGDTAASACATIAPVVPATIVVTTGKSKMDEDSVKTYLCRVILRYSKSVSVDRVKCDLNPHDIHHVKANEQRQRDI